MSSIARKSRLMTDEAPYYPAIGTRFAGHESVNHSAEEWARSDAHTNTLEGFFSIFKRGMRGTYHHCGEKHLHRTSLSSISGTTTASRSACATLPAPTLRYAG
jgi:hypothetical protein